MSLVKTGDGAVNLAQHMYLVLLHSVELGCPTNLTNLAVYIWRAHVMLYHAKN